MSDEQTVINAISNGTINLDNGGQADTFLLSVASSTGTFLYEVTEGGADDVLTTADTITLVATFSDLTTGFADTSDLIVA